MDAVAFYVHNTSCIGLCVIESERFAACGLAIYTEYSIIYSTEACLAFRLHS